MSEASSKLSQNHNHGNRSLCHPPSRSHRLKTYPSQEQVRGFCGYVLSLFHLCLIKINLIENKIYSSKRFVLLLFLFLFLLCGLNYLN